MRLYIFALSALLCSITGFGQHKSQPITIGETVTLHSEILQQERKLNIYLPQGYSPDSIKRYPVLYLLDGSMHEDFIHVSGLTQFASFSWINMMPECIVVGIANTDRYHDFTSPCDKKEYKEIIENNGGSEDFTSFLEKEVQPFIDQNYKTTKSKTLIGQSLGGLLATEILFKHPDLFDNYLIVSPSLWWDDQSLLETTPLPYSSDKSVYVAVGNEGKVMKKVARKLYSKLKKVSPETTSVYFRYFPELDHGDALHQSVYYGVKKIFYPEKRD